MLIRFSVFDDQSTSGIGGRDYYIISDIDALILHCNPLCRTMSADPVRQTLSPSEDHSPTSTLTPAPEITAVKQEEHDAEKQPPAGPPMIPGGPFPDGGLKAWAAVLGAWLAGRFRSLLATSVKGGKGGMLNR